MVAATAKADYAIADSKERPVRSMCIRFSSMHVPMPLIVYQIAFKWCCSLQTKLIHKHQNYTKQMEWINETEKRAKKGKETTRRWFA